MPSSSSAAVELQNVSFTYGEQHVFSSLNLRIAAGEYAGIIGPNGSGKTTLLKLILGILSPTSGTVHLFGEDVRRAAARSAIGYVPQRVAQSDFFFPATVEEVVWSGRTPRLGLFGRSGDADRTAVENALRVTQLADVRGRRVAHLSGGQRQRVFLARALAGEPSLLVLDEPTVGIDAASQELFYGFLQKLNEEQKLTILFVSHDTHALMKEVTCMLCLQEGELCGCSTDELHRHDHVSRHLMGAVPHTHA